MAVREIITIGDPILTKRATEVSKVSKKIVKIGEDMVETMYEAKGVGLAAPQIGLGRRIIVFDVGEGPVILFNPVIIQGLGKKLTWKAA